MSALLGFDQPLSAEVLTGGRSTFEDRWYQTEAVNALFDYFAANGGTDENGLPVKANPLICLPTGTGKSVVIAKFIWRAMTEYPGTRVFMSTHVKTLIAQNAKKMLEVWPNAPLGIYSAGLKRREHTQPIIFGGVQSCAGKFPLFGRRDLLVVDEAHLIGEEGRYLQFIKELTEGSQIGHNGGPPMEGTFNPYLKVIGLSATPYRMGLGLMTNGSIFTDIAYNLCTIDGFTRLMAEGFLCPLLPKPTSTQLDISKVGMSGNDYNQGALQAAVDKYETTYAALCETMHYGHDRASWLVFASGVEHAEHIGEMLNTVFGVPTVVIHSKKSETENDANLLLWQQGKVRAAVSMNSLTTGVDHPACDFIVMLRPTMSPGLWVQMLGRGTRTYDSTKCTDPIIAAAFPGIKLNCLVLDFAGNTQRLGPINDPLIPRLKGSGPPGDAPVKICPVDKIDIHGKRGCGFYNHTTAKVCLVCEFEWAYSENVDKTASELELIRSNLPQRENFTVSRSVIVPHTSMAGNAGIKVAYYCGMRTFYEYINFEAKIPFVRKKARDWFRQRYHYQVEHLDWDSDVPSTNNEVLALTNELRHPASINVWINKPTPEIMGYSF